MDCRRGRRPKKNRACFLKKLQLPEPDSIGLRYPHQVSGGQLQRIMTAMAMATRPDLIIFDEPTTALDVTTQIEVLAAIREVVREKGAAALYISHDLAVVGAKWPSRIFGAERRQAGGGGAGADNAGVAGGRLHQVALGGAPLSQRRAAAAVVAAAFAGGKFACRLRRR